MHELSQINTTGFFGKVDLISNISEEFSENGALLKADIKERDDEKTFWTQLQSVENEIWVSKTQIKKLSEIQEQQFIDFSVGLLANMVSNVGEIMSISQLMFLDDDGITENFRIDNESFDMTFTSMPFYWQNNEHQFPTEITILDIELLSVYPAKVEYIAKETMIDANSIEVLTYHYRIIPLKSKPIDIWIASNTKNIPYFFQVVGEDKNGKFQIKIK